MQPGDREDKPIFGFDAFDLANRMLDENEAEQFHPKDFGLYHFVGDKALGAGGLGDVWLAEEGGSERLVAVKFLRRVANPSLAVGEVKAQGKLEHSNIARLYGSGQLEDGTPWIAMEYVRGRPLDEYCKEQNCTISQRIELFRGICEAVKYAHGEMVLHGDLKPSNLLVKGDGQPKLLDFGLAQRLQKSDAATDAKRATAGFTAAYASPEQLRGMSSGFRSDIYSLGVVLHELLTGELPFHASRRTSIEVERSKMNDERPEPPSVAAKRNRALEISDAGWRDLDAICLKAMENDANLRYSSVEALIQDLGRYQRHKPLAARQPYPRGYRLGKFLRRNLTSIAIASAGFLVLAGLVTFYTLRLARERNKALVEAERTRRIQRVMLDLFENGDQQSAPSATLSVLQVLEHGVAITSSLNADPETQAELYRTLGAIYQRLSNYPKAESLLERSVGTSRKLGPNNEQTMRSLVQLGLLRGDQARFPEAERFIQEALDTAQKLRLAPGNLELADAKVALGKVLVQAGSYDKAIGILQPIAGRPPEGEDGQLVLTESLTALAVAKQYTGHYDEAELLNRRALEVDRKIHGEAHPRVAYDLSNIATAEISRLRYTEAERLYRESANILEHWYGVENPEVLQVRSFIALAEIQLGHSAEAEKLLRGILPIQQRAFGDVHPVIAFTYDTLGKLASKRGDLPEAEADLIHAAEIGDKLYGENEAKRAVIDNDLGDVLVREGKYARAEKVLRPAVRVLTQRPLPGNMNVGMAQLNLGEALFGQKRYRDAEPFLLAAYGILKPNPGNYAQRLQDARKTLAELYQALGQSDQAAKFR